MAGAASLELHETLRRIEHHGLGLDRVSRTARQAVTAWLMAIDGDESALDGHAEPQVVNFLLRDPWKRWRVVPGVTVTRIQISHLETDAEPVLLDLTFHFSGTRHFPDPRLTTAAERAEGETEFVGLFTLALPDSADQRWSLRLGSVDTLDGFLGYAFTSRRETTDEARQRTGSPATLDGTRILRSFRLTAGFTEDDVKFGWEVTTCVRREAALSRDEAAELIWPAIEAEISRVLGPGDWRPSLRRLEVVEMIGE